MKEILQLFFHWMQTYIAVRYIVIFLLLAILMYNSFWITRKVLLAASHLMVAKTKTKWDDVLCDRNFFSRLANISPAIIVYYTSMYFPEYAIFFQKAAYIYTIIIFLLVMDSFLNAANDIYEGYEISRYRPIKSFLEIFKIIFIIIGIIIIVSILINKSPWVILSGLGALMAVVILVFRDTILSFVASIKISSTNLLKRGDWIEMPQFGADGEVIDISLNTIQIQNWDKTIVSIPTYKFLDESFKNWRGMQESSGRRIKRAVNIDISTIRYADDALKKNLGKIHYLKKILEEKEKEIAEYNKKNKTDVRMSVNGRRLTNIGLLRYYIREYLHHDPAISKKMTFLVRQLAPTSKGLPLEIYVFSNDKIWENYEDIQSDIFDHILAAIPYFDLRVFQEPSGNSFQKLIGGKKAE